MALNGSRLNDTINRNKISSGIITRRILCRATNLKPNGAAEKNPNFMQNYGQFKTDFSWYGVDNNETTVNGPPNLAPVYTPRVHRYPFKHNSKQLPRQISFEEPPSNLNRLFAESSVPGVRDIAGARNIIRKAFWFICFLILGVLALRDISQLVSEYFMYPITVNVRLRDSRRLLFPAITVCNLNIVRYSALCNSTVSIVNMSMIPPDLADKLCGTQAFSDSRPVPTTKPISHDETPITDDINNYGNIADKKPKPTTEESEEMEAPKFERTKRQAQFKTTSSSSPYPYNPNAGNGLEEHKTMNSPNSGNSPLDEIELTEREEKELQENLTNWLAVMHNSNEKITKMLGHQFEDMILRCTIKATNCTHPKSFEQIFTPTEGNCFTYKSMTRSGKKGTKKKQEETSLAGVNYGLELVLNLEINEYLPGSAQIGALVMVHHPDDFGNSASEAIFVAPQQATYIGLKMINISRLPAPYPEDCVDSWPLHLTGSHMNLTQNATYSQQACLKICLQMTIQDKCNCQSAMLPQLELNSTELKICDTRKKSTRKCVEQVMFRSQEDNVNDCSCPPRCQVVNYDKTVSVARWPTREDRVTFDRGKPNINFQNLAKVVVYFQTMTCQEVTQQSAYTTAKLFSSLGGILGMYVGFSFLSLFEIIEVFVRRLWYCCTKKKHRFKAAVHTITATLAMSNRNNQNQSFNPNRHVHFQS